MLHSLCSVKKDPCFNFSRQRGKNTASLCDVVQEGIRYSDAEAGKKGAVAEDREVPKTEPEAKKSKAGKGAKKNEKGSRRRVSPVWGLSTDEKTSPSDKSATLKICSWNVDGLWAWIKKKSLDWINEETPETLYLQETKCSENKLPDELQEPPGLCHQ